MSDVESDFTELKTKAQNALIKGRAIESELDETTNSTEFINALNTLNTTLQNENMAKNVHELEKAITTLATNLNKLSERIEKQET
jgi:7,8-dihydro-6-hydroxymethylpterin-pyrophosphokinase